MATADETSFGERLRQLRIAAGLTQEALAARSGLSVRGISDLERGARRRPQRETIRMLAEALGVRFEDFRVERPRHDSHTSVLVSTSPSIPVPLTSFVGREHEVAKIIELLHEPGVRLVTLTGPGGVGKTRLAIRVANDVARAFPHGVYFVDLATITDPSLVCTTLTHVLNIREVGGRSVRGRIAEALKDRKLLVVLDNFEHLVAAANDIAAVLRDSPGLTAIITSRASLQISGEQEFSVQPLPVPDDTLSDPNLLLEFPAIRLFCERARQRLVDFELSQHNAVAISVICRALDGLPLAIELAAARSKTLPPADMVAYLDRPLDLLARGPFDHPERHRALRNTIQWSYDLLDPRQQQIFKSLGILAGGWTLEAAAAVSPESEDESGILEVVEDLVNASLIVAIRDTGPIARFRMMETVRWFAIEQLARNRELETVAKRHCDYYARIVNVAAPDLTGRNQQPTVDRLVQDEANIRTALRWAVDNDLMAALSMCRDLWRFWYMRGQYTEGRTWVVQALERPGDVPQSLRREVRYAAGVLAQENGDFEAAHEFFADCLTESRAVADSRGIATGLLGLGNIAASHMQPERAQARWNESLARFRELGDDRSTAQVLHNLGNLAMLTGHSDEAQPLIAEAGAIFRRVGDHWGIAGIEKDLGWIAIVQGDDQRAAFHLRAALQRCWNMKQMRQVAGTLVAIAALSGNRGDHRRAIQLAAAASSLYDRIDYTPADIERERDQRHLRASSQRLGRRDANRVWETGANMSLDATVALALADLRADDGTAVPPSTTDPTEHTPAS